MTNNESLWCKCQLDHTTLITCQRVFKSLFSGKCLQIPSQLPWDLKPEQSSQHGWKVATEFRGVICPRNYSTHLSLFYQRSLLIQFQYQLPKQSQFTENNTFSAIAEAILGLQGENHNLNLHQLFTIKLATNIGQNIISFLCCQFYIVISK